MEISINTSRNDARVGGITAPSGTGGTAASILTMWTPSISVWTATERSTSVWWIVWNNRPPRKEMNPRLLARAIENCQDYFWANASYVVVFY